MILYIQKTRTFIQLADCSYFKVEIEPKGENAFALILAVVRKNDEVEIYDLEGYADAQSASAAAKEAADGLANTLTKGSRVISFLDEAV